MQLEQGLRGQQQDFDLLGRASRGALQVPVGQRQQLMKSGGQGHRQLMQAALRSLDQLIVSKGDDDKNGAALQSTQLPQFISAACHAYI